MENKNVLVGTKLIKKILDKFIELVDKEDADIYINDLSGIRCIITYKSKWSIIIRPYFEYVGKGIVKNYDIGIKFYSKSDSEYKFENLLEYESFGDNEYLKDIKDTAIKLYKLAESKIKTHNLLLEVEIGANTFTHVYNNFINETN